ncbi:MFS transporter [Dactylosporangium sp. AC04546]|uniref:MFS transporter n=1 Tax=Dactylosporangium sp. AC04546 TaxID=2862460 RepID=UPI001EE0E27C|nr:MFS transporter [Dactylosporangium sp. AC04546]WVK80174.1 MFS transporter [Dactylosporangium sp. AC04546]
MIARGTVALSYVLFILVGLGAGVNGVVLLPQLHDYGVDRTLFGLVFFAGSAGFVAAGAVTGPFVHRWGCRAALLLGVATYVLGGLYIATRPPFAAFVLVQLLTGFGTGLLESVLNAYVAALPEATGRLNRLHAFFGAGALLGPLLATWMLRFTTWPIVFLALAGVAVPLGLAVAALFPRRAADPAVAVSEEHTGRRLLGPALRSRVVLLGSLLLTVYVGLEIGVGNWAYSYLVEARSVSGTAAGATISLYWLGLTLGRFVLGSAATRAGLTATGLMYGCLAGITVAAALTWALPGAVPLAAGFALLGFFLGPVFPTAMVVVPPLAGPGLAPTAIGVMNAGSVVGGAALPWLAGAVTQGYGAWTLMPFALVLAFAQLAVWWPVAAGSPLTTRPRQEELTRA